MYFFCFLVCSCSTVKEKGFHFDDMEKIERFDVYNFTKEDLSNNIGDPSVVLDDNNWLYYSYKYKNPSFFKNSIYKEQILIVQFDNKDNIIKHKFFTRDKIGDIKYLKEESQKNADDKGFFNEFFDSATPTLMK